MILSLTSLGIYPVATFCMMFSDIGLACNIVAFFIKCKLLLWTEEGVKKWGDNLSDITIHELKILPAYFNDVFSGRKNFEIRKNDRGFRVNHILMLRIWRQKNYTGSYTQEDHLYHRL